MFGCWRDIQRSLFFLFEYDFSQENTNSQNTGMLLVFPTHNVEEKEAFPNQR